jgi:hypothetical protein
MGNRVRGLAVWRPRARSLALVEQVEAIFAEYADFLPLTIRQIFYRLVGVHGYEKTEGAYKRLGDALNRARRSGIISWETIRDDGFQIQTPTAWDSPEQLAAAFLDGLHSFRLDRQDGQPLRLLIAVEAAGMLPQVQRIADQYGVPCYAAGGYDSTTAKYELAAYLSRASPVELLHIGDHDPSGVHLFKNLAEDVTALAADLAEEPDDLDIQFSRLAVTPEQIADLRLPTAPPKATDRRSFTGQTTQAEAIPPDTMAEIIRDAIRGRIDLDAFQETMERERQIRRMSRAEIGRLIRRLPATPGERS